MLKQAYLIMIHEYTLVLKRLIQLLDDENSGIYIHVDKNAVSVGKNEIEKIQKLAKKSQISIYRKYKVYWGTNSITNAEIFLLSKALNDKYDYYHVLSGADLPIKPLKEIQRFFEINNGKEFIHFGTEQYQYDIIERYNVYHFFSRKLGRKRDKKFWVDAETYSLAVQRRLHVDRTKRLDFSFYGGSNWCSITRGFAQYAVKNYMKYKRAFRFSQISDEAVWQTIVMDSPYKENLYQKEYENDYRACMRYIDWNRGTPYVFREDDFDDLMHSDCLFARKFDEKTDKGIIDRIY
ncbi:MAG: beta-1,6-N-acetylglucosaminyltransferase, partial [Lachnospiraceae bacterium]|nr:beta-1,6-N-acetylglucosaminyltransferase [Lachnospiraceae bacterium]